MVVLNERGNDATVLIGDGKGGFTPARGSPIAAGDRPNDLAAGDFDRDGHLDLAVANHETSYLTVLLGDGRGGIPRRASFAAGRQSSSRIPTASQPATSMAMGASTW